jgi:hypothetical protein
MDKLQVDPKNGFKVLSQTKRSEVASMVIKPGDKEGGPENKHEADQWLYVIAGRELPPYMVSKVAEVRCHYRSANLKG